MPVRDLRTASPCHPSRRRPDESLREDAMDATRTASSLTRRHFIVTAATAAGGFAIGIGAAPGARAATVVAQPWNDDNAYAANEIDAWIAIDPDDSILIRYQRS